MESFAYRLGNLLESVAAGHGLAYTQGGAAAWGIAGAAYLSFVHGFLDTRSVRNAQYAARELTGPIHLDCKWYDSMVEQLFDGRQSIDTLLPLPDGAMKHQAVSKEEFLEMLDFCREG